MSLKAKLEAVIYAAEEPVTLAQLSALFSGEVLTEMAASAAEPAAEAIPEPGVEAAGDPAPELWPESGTDQAADVPAVAVASEAGNAALATGPADEVDTQADTQAGSQAGDQAEGQAEDDGKVDPSAAVDEKQAARLRERQARSGLKQILDTLMVEYASGDRGMEIREIAGGYRMATKPEYHDAVRGFVKSLKPPLKLSIPALETLAVVAYKQPVTAPEVSEIRGVDSGGVLGSLISRKLIATAGRKQVIGRPILYKTTKEFLLRFGLKDLGDLPSMEEFEKMASEIEAAEQETEAAPDSEELAFAPPGDAPASPDAPVEDVGQSDEPAGANEPFSGPAITAEESRAEGEQPENEPAPVSSASSSEPEG